jgi:shikimate kinase / 3-dehydroquinate synthase
MTQSASLEDGLHRDERAAALVRALGGRSIALVGMMGAGKTSVGRRLAQRLGLPFADADIEIETAARMSIAEIFARHGEPFFRDRERQVIVRLLAEGQKVLATGGGAFAQQATRERIRENSVSVWLKADFDVLARRVRRRTNRPKLATDDPEQTLRRLIEERYPLYALADYAVISHEGAHEAVVEAVFSTLEKAFGTAPRAEERTQTKGADGSTSTMVAVPVELDARAYEILIGDGLLAEAGRHIRRVAPGAACFIVSDENVAARHLQPLVAGLESAGVRHESLVLEAGEGTKSFAWFERVCESIIGARMERGDCVVALGGGVVGDLTGFAAATVRRGMRLIQLPTSLLAQVDSSVGGKTAINTRHGKNLIGAFHQPSLVLADTRVLETLPMREFRAGYAEVVKYGLIDDAGFFEWLERNRLGVFAQGPELREAIRVSCASKAKIVARDETEQGDRMLLNLGHTFGHALERLTGYESDRLNHGEGVAIGLSCAFRFSVRLGHCRGQDAARVEAHLRDAGLPTRIRATPGLDSDAETILDAMRQDKKVSGGALTFILARGIGQSFVARGVPATEVRAFLEEELSDC